MRTSRPYWAIPLTVVATLAAVIGGTLPAMLLLDPESPTGSLAGGLGVTAAALLLVFLWRRFLLRRPWTGVGMRWDRKALPQALLGAAAAAAAVLAAHLLSVAVGAAEWLPWSEFREQTGPLLPTVVVILSVSVLLQGFPEELLWRGNLYDVLGSALSPRMVLLLTSLFFGLLHLVSLSPASGVAEQLLYVVMATALGFACGAARERTGTLWLAVGVHSGLHLGLRSIPIEATNYPAWLAFLTVTLTAAGVLLLGRSRGQRLPTGVASAASRESQAN